MPLLAPGEVGDAGYEAGVVLGEWPIDLGDLALDRVDEFGGQWNVTAFTGKGSAPTAVEVNQRTAGDGSWIGGRWWAAKPYSIDIAYEGDTAQDRWNAEQRLLAAVGVDDTVMVMNEEVPRRTTVVLNGEIAIDAVNVYAFTAQVPLLAVDPFRYALVPDLLGSTMLPQASGGLQWPATWPATWSATIVSGALAVVNSGNRTAFPVFQVFGPLPDFSLTNVETGEQLVVDLAADGESLAAGEWMEVDMRRQRVMLLGQSSRRRALRGSFFGLPPGPSEVRFGSSVQNTTAFVEIEGYSTWK